jgi:hypothetical protein
VVVCNRSSWVDCLVLSATTGAAFTTTSAEGGLAHASLLQALAASTRVLPARWAGSGTAAAATRAVILSQARSGGGPLVVFPEPCNTNNRAVMTFTPLADQVADAVVDIARGRDAATVKARVPITHVVVVRYTLPAGAFPVPYVVGPVVPHVLGVASQPSNGVALLTPTAGFQPQPADHFAPPAAGDGAGASGSGSGSGGGATPASPTTWPDAARDVMAQLLRGSKPVALGYVEYQAFRQQWAEAAQSGRGPEPSDQKRE